MGNTLFAVLRGGLDSDILPPPGSPSLPRQRHARHGTIPCEDRLAGESPATGGYVYPNCDDDRLSYGV